MIIKYYLLMTILSLACAAIYLWKWHKHFAIHYSAIYMLIPLLNAGYLLTAVSKDVGEALTATKITYLGGCYLLLIILMSIFSLCKINLPRFIPFGFITLSTLVYISVLSAGHFSIFYKSVDIKTVNGVTRLLKVYGPMHSVFYYMMLLYFALSIGTIIYSLYKKNDAPKKSLILLLITESVSIFAFFFGRMVSDDVEWIPAAYLFDAFIYLFVTDKLPLYDVAQTVGESLVEHGAYGFVSLDMNLNFLGANATARELLPALSDTKADLPISDEKLAMNVLGWINDFKKDEITRDLYLENKGKILKIRTSYLYDGNRQRGYQLTVTDDSSHQQYLRAIADYNRKLRKEIELKSNP